MRYRKELFILCTTAGMECDGRNRKRSKRRNLTKWHQRLAATMSWSFRTANRGLNHLSAQFSAPPLQWRSLRFHRPGCNRNLSAGQQIQYRPHQESPHRQGINYPEEGRHLHCRLRVRALV